MHKCDVARSEKRQNRWRGKKFRFDEVHGRRQKTTERVGVPFGRTGFREIHPPLPTASVTITYALVATPPRHFRREGASQVPLRLSDKLPKFEAFSNKLAVPAPGFSGLTLTSPMSVTRLPCTLSIVPRRGEGFRVSDRARHCRREGKQGAQSRRIK